MVIFVMQSHVEDEHGDINASEAAFHKALVYAKQLTRDHNSCCALHSSIRCGHDRLVRNATNCKYGK